MTCFLDIRSWRALGWTAMHLGQGHEQRGFIKLDRQETRSRCYNFVSLYFTDQRGPLRLDGQISIEKGGPRINASSLIAILCLHTLHSYLNLQTETCFYLPNTIISYIRHPHHLLKKTPNPISFCFHFEVMLILLPVMSHSLFDSFQLIIDSKL